MRNEADVPIWDHTKAKHDILKDYLGAWYTIIGGAAARGGYSWDAMWYVEWFAGPGLKQEYEGSPLKALDVIQGILRAPSRPVSVERCPVLLLDADQKVVESLAAAIEAKQPEMPDVRLWKPGDLAEAKALLMDAAQCPQRIPVICVAAPFQQAAPALLSGIPDSAPQFHFVDPHGYSQIPFSAVRSILARRWSEALITFMADFIHRSQDDPSKRNTIDAVFGSSDWRSPSAQALAEEYQDRLRSIAADLLVCSYPVRHEQTGHDSFYHLVHASHRLRAFITMKEVMWKRSPGSDLGFAGSQHRMFAETESLFDVPAYFLSTDLAATFAGRAISFEEVREFVERHTRHTAAHARAAVKELETQGAVKITRPPTTRGHLLSDECTVQFS